MALIEQLKETQKALEKLLVLLESAERDRFVSHLYQSRRDYQRACEIARKSGKQIERCVISMTSQLLRAIKEKNLKAVRMHQLGTAQSAA